ncbi:hypothetical protein KW800_01830 [Candidatus Parcubacteria bacterium]|nr:hypothetical protein [Candidatus Parcubacteria bacterium]
MNIKRDLSILAVVVLVAICGGVLYMRPALHPIVTPGPTGTGQTQVLPLDGTVVLHLGETASFRNLTLTPTQLVEDSRCPQDVQCIQAGTVRVKVDVSSGLGNAASILKLGEVFTTESERITLTEVSPSKLSSVTIAPADYQFTFLVESQASHIDNGSTSGKCYVGGCSSQICSDEPNAVSTCEYTAAYACYKTAKCERQSTGKCGWTPSTALNMCLKNPPSL